MKVKLKPTRHGKWSVRKQDSIDKKMRLVRELFSVNGAELNHGSSIPEVRFVRFYGNERRFTLDTDGNCIVYINDKYIKSRDLDYIVLCALCFYYTEKRPELILGGTVTMVDLHASIDFSGSHLKDILIVTAKNVAAIALTRLIVSTIS